MEQHNFHSYARWLLISFLLLNISVKETYSAAPSRTQTYTNGETISSTEVTENEDNIYDYLQAGVDTYADDSIVNADVNSSANIQSDKLNLTSVAQAVSITSAGSLTVNGTTTLNGTNDLGSVTGTDEMNTATATAGRIFVSDGTDFESMQLTGDATINTAGYIDLVSGVVGTAEIATDGVGTAELAFLNSATATAGRILVSDGTDFESMQLTGDATINTAGYIDVTVGSAWSFIESSTFTSSASVSITETISSGDVYNIIYEIDPDDTVTAQARINSDATGSNYNYAVDAQSSNGSTFTADDVLSTAANAIQLQGDENPTLAASEITIIDMKITARDSATQLTWTLNGTTSDGLVTHYANGVASYDAGTPTSIQLIGGGANTRLTGRYYVFKASTQ